MRNKLFTLTLILLTLAFGMNAQKMTSAKQVPLDELSIEQVKAARASIVNVNKYQASSYDYLLSVRSSKDSAFTEDFEGGVLPAGWTTQDGANAWVVSEDNSSTYWAIPEHSFYASINDDLGGSGADNSDTYIATPEIDLSTLTTPALTFDALPDNAYGGIHVVFASTDAGTTWDTLQVLTGSTSWVTTTINLVDYIGETSLMLAFHYNDEAGWMTGFAIDNVVIADLPEDEFAVSDIAVPYFNTVGAVSTLSATIVNNGLTAQTKDVVFKLDGVELATVTSGSLAYGESETVTYDWTPAAGGNFIVSAEVATDEDDSNNMLDANAAAYVDGQLVQDFEGDFLPFGWSESAAARGWGRSTSATFQIFDFSALMGQTVNSPEEVLITPPLVLDGSVSTLSYWAAGVNNEFGLGASTLVLKYMEVGGTEWTVLGDSIYMGEGEAARLVEADLSGLANGNYYFAFSAESTFDYLTYTSYVLLDNIVGPEVMALNTITLNVTDGTDPLEDVDVVFGDQTRSTDDAGDAIFGVLDGSYDWTASLMGYYDEAGTEVVAGADATVDVALDIMPVAKFVVTDGTDPLEGATVAIEGQDLTTDVDGMAMISLDPGTYDFTASFAGYFDSTATVTLVGGDTTTVDVGLILQPVYDVTFTVTDGTDPLEGVMLMVADQTLTTDASGVAVAVGLFDGDFYYVATDSAYLDSYGTVTVAGAALAVDVTMEMIPAGMVLFTDDFEGYEVGDLVAQSSSYWETWTGAAGGGGDDAAVSDDFANSPTKSMLIADGGADDMIFPLGDKSEGLYSISFYVYVESGADYEGYFNFQGTSTPGDVFAFETYFLQDGTGTINVNGDVTFNYTQDSWELIQVIVDLDNDYASLRINGEYVTSWEYVENLGGIDIFAGAEDGTPKFYVDDITYTDLYFSGGFATFTVTDGTDPIEGAEVDVNGFTLTTDAAGQAVQLLDDGVYDYTVSAMGYDDYSGSVTVAAADVAVDVALVMQYSVTFNIDMTDANFDPANDRVFVSGATADGSAGIGDNAAWPWPQANTNFEAFDADEDMVYTVIVPYVSIGDYQYKYGFTTPGNPPNWSNPFPVNDTLEFAVVDADVTVNDAWVGLGETSELTGFNIYPNPTNGIVTIGTDNQCEVTVTNAIGQVVVNRIVSNNEKLDLTNQTQGLYFITAKTDAAVKTLRLIIE